MSQLVVFDVCDTLYNVNTTFKFLDKICVDNKKYKIFRIISKIYPIIVLNYFFYKITNLDIIRFFGTLFLKGRDINEIKKITNIFVYENLVPEIKKIVSEKIHYYKKKGYRVVLMSGSYDFVIREVAEYFNADEFYASKLKTIDGVFTGRYDKDILMRKRDLLNKSYKKIDKLVVISNNKTDLELMKSADKAFAVCNKEKDLKFWKSFKQIEYIKDF